jgi:hypothetical protein
MRRCFILSLAAVLSQACGGNETPVVAPAVTNTSPVVTSVVSTATATPMPASTMSAPATSVVVPPKNSPVAKWEGMLAPQSVLFDEVRDRYLVANVNGTEKDFDNDGFISELSPDGKVTKLKFIEGTPKEPLNAPKGMTIVGNTLYVVDVNRVCMFDVASGKSKGIVQGKGVVFLSDITASPDGRIFVSDSGLKDGTKDGEKAGADTIWQVKGKTMTVYLKDAELARPNGLSWTTFGLAVASYGDARVAILGEEAGAKPGTKPKFVKITKMPASGLDGMVADSTGFWASSWTGRAIYRGTFEGAVTPILEGVETPADFAIDGKRKRIVIPRFKANIVEAYDLK